MHTLTRCLTDPIRLPGQMHVYVANSDPEIGEVVRIGYGDLVAYAEQVSGLSPERISSFLAAGMLLSVLALMQVQDGAEHWAATLLEGCMSTCRASAPDPLLMGALCGKSLPEDAATLAGSPVARQRARVTRSSTRAANGMCGERQTCRSANGHA
jgi:hypothetical protein